MNTKPISPVAGFALAATAIILVVFLLVGASAGCKEYNRYQKRADAKNRTLIVKQGIQTAKQQVLIVHAQNGAVKAKAEQRVIEAEGIRKAQDLISKTLTPLYVQHEAIKAQENDRQGDRTYIPVGPQGVPLVANVNGQSVGR